MTLPDISGGDLQGVSCTCVTELTDVIVPFVLKGQISCTCVTELTNVIVPFV